MTGYSFSVNYLLEGAAAVVSSSVYKTLPRAACVHASGKEPWLCDLFIYLLGLLKQLFRDVSSGT